MTKLQNIMGSLEPSIMTKIEEAIDSEERSFVLGLKKEAESLCFEMRRVIGTHFECRDVSDEELDGIMISLNDKVNEVRKFEPFYVAGRGMD